MFDASVEERLVDRAIHSSQEDVAEGSNRPSKKGRGRGKTH